MSELDDVFFSQPVVILGGFLSFPAAYTGMKKNLSHFAQQPVQVVETTSLVWLRTVRKSGWATVLDLLDQAVKQIVRASATGRVTLIGHSIGGILARLYLSPQPFQGRRYNGMKYVNCLVTLGSPHKNQGGFRRGGPLSRWVEQHCPGAAFYPEVQYISVAGKWLRGSRLGSSLARFAYGVYESICGNGAVWGDGIVPVEAALLNGAHHIVLDGVSHYTVLGEPWYGSQEAILQWWNNSGGAL